MLKTTTKEAREQIKAYILEHFDPCGYDFQGSPDNWEEVADFLRRTFREEKRYQRGKQEELFHDWAQGLPSILDTCYYYNRSAVDDLAAVLEETEAEKARFTEPEAEKMLTHLIYRELFRGKVVC